MAFRRPIASLLLVPAFLFGPAALMGPSSAEATWSVIAIDRERGTVVIASATCVSQAALLRFPSEGLRDIQAVVVPGVGVAAAQAGVDRTRENQRLIHRELLAGTHPERILDMLREDPQIERRQFAILDMAGRWAGFSGENNGAAALAMPGEVPGTGIHFSVQGNILAGDDVVHDAVRAFMEAGGSLTDRVMAAMEAADAAGGDRRCTCETEPVPEAQCTDRSSHVAYILAAGPDDRAGGGFNDGEWSLFIDVHDQNIEPHENANPVITLRQRYDAWRDSRPEGRASRALRSAEPGAPVRFRTPPPLQAPAARPAPPPCRAARWPAAPSRATSGPP
jgi:uncharacterized Ntn-hydrolase superfamily protein